MRTVTEADFRQPEYRDARVEDYEFRDDGKLVRKDRWMRAIMALRHLLLPGQRDFEIDDILARVKQYHALHTGWLPNPLDRQLPAAQVFFDDEEGDRVALRAVWPVELLLSNGSLLRGAYWTNQGWYWLGDPLSPYARVVAWRRLGPSTLKEFSEIEALE